MKMLENNYDNCSNVSCKFILQKEGFNNAIEAFVDKADESLGVSDYDIYCKEAINWIANQLRTK